MVFRLLSFLEKLDIEGDTDMVDVEKLQKKILKFDANHNLSAIEEDTFSAIVLLTEKKVQIKNMMKKYPIGERYNNVVKVIAAEFPKCDFRQLTWFLFKNGYIKRGTLYFLFIPSMIAFLIGWLTFLIMSFEFSFFIFLSLIFSVIAWFIFMAFICYDHIG